MENHKYSNQRKKSNQNNDNYQGYNIILAIDIHAHDNKASEQRNNQ